MCSWAGGASAGWTATDRGCIPKSQKLPEPDSGPCPVVIWGLLGLACINRGGLLQSTSQHPSIPNNWHGCTQFYVYIQESHCIISLPRPSDSLSCLSGAPISLTTWNPYKTAPAFA
ncbi:hypothetical protein CI102_12632 [Trichoderma harzianum]|nr:hypothetical protein CI102_12632 [Trichoderma harzianum]